MEKIIINNEEYIKVEYVKIIDPNIFKKIDPVRDYIKKTKLSNQEYVYAYLRKRDKQWKQATKKSKRSQVLLSINWLKIKSKKLSHYFSNLNKNNSLSKPDDSFSNDAINSIQEPILKIDNKLIFKNSSGTRINITLRGERKKNKIYFKLKDIEKEFKLNYSKKNLINKNYYKYFSEKHGNKINKVIYVTYDSLKQYTDLISFQCLHNYLVWVDDNLLSNIKKTNPHREFINASATNYSCIYLFTIGSVKELRNIMNIPSNRDDNDLVCKFGYSKDIKRRMIEHNTEYGQYLNKNITLSLHAYIDPSFNSQAEVSIKNHFKETKSLFSFKNYKELVIVNKKKIGKTIKERYENIYYRYRGDNTELILKIKDLEHELEIEKLKNKYLKVRNENLLLRLAKFEKNI